MNVNDKISFEYEARSMIDEKLYNKLVKECSNNYECIKSVNINIYYDTDNLHLTNHSIVLRKRTIGENIECTLKIKDVDFDTEITNAIFLKDATLPQMLTPNMATLLSNNGVDINDLKEVGSLTTERIEIQFEKFLFVIDKNLYNDKVDFNLEVESDSRENAKIYLEAILKKYGAQMDTNYISKSRRAIFKL